MLSFIKQVFIALLSFSECLARDRTKCLFLNGEQRMIRLTPIHLNPGKLKYYLFMISLDKCNGSFNFLSPKICVTKETKDINLKAFNMLTNKNEAKTMIKHI